jgi:DNA repair exonuclease SbcCD nuclease subunit
MFHDRQKIDVLTYQKSFEILEKHLTGGLELHMLLGNHDLWHYQKMDVSSVNPLRMLPGIKIINKPSVHSVGGFFFGFLPYTHDPISDLKKVEAEWDEVAAGQKKVLGGHISVDGAVWNVRHNTVSDVMVEHDGDMVKVGPGIFSNWDRVFLGHYHAAQKLDDKVEYVGSPLQLSFGEAFQKKHLVILDTEGLSCEYVENDFSPVHLILKEDELDGHDLEGNFVRVEVDDIVGKQASDMRQRLVEESGVSSLEIKQSPRREEHIIKDAKAILHDEEQMLEKYVEQVGPSDLDRELLIKIGSEICGRDA